MKDNSRKSWNRRESKRIEAVKLVRYKVLKPLTGIGITQDISEGGLCFLLNKGLSHGSVVELTIDNLNEDSNSVKVVGEVVWQNGYLVGVKFLN